MGELDLAIQGARTGFFCMTDGGLCRDGNLEIGVEFLKDFAFVESEKSVMRNDGAVYKIPLNSLTPKSLWHNRVYQLSPSERGICEDLVEHLKNPLFGY